MFSHNSGLHRSLTLAFEQFPFWLQIRGDIRNKKSTPRLGESGSRRLPVSVSQGVGYWIFKGGTCCAWGTWKMKSSGQHNSHNSGQYRSFTLAFDQFQFWLRIPGNIRNKKSTPPLGESGSRRLPVSVSWGVGYWFFKGGTCCAWGTWKKKEATSIICIIQVSIGPYTSFRAVLILASNLWRYS